MSYGTTDPNQSLPAQSQEVQTHGSQAAYQRQQVLEAMQEMLDYFGGLALPEECTEEFPEIHQLVWELTTAALHGRTEAGEVLRKWYMRFAIALPRGHGKTQLVKFLIAYAILFTDLRYVMVVSNGTSLSRSIINDVCDMLSGANIVALFGDWRTDIESDNEENKIFSFRGRMVILKPMGIGSSLRGTNIRNRRPELIICDDLQSKEEAESQEIGKKQLQWFLGTLLKARSYERCVVIYVGNMYRDVEIGEKGSGIFACILRNLQKSPEWKTVITGGILSDGSALWEAVISKEVLLSDLRMDTSMGQADLWYAEVQNDPAGAGSKRFDVTAVPEYPYLAEEDAGQEPVGKFIVIDPSLGKKDSDAQVVTLFYVYDFTSPVAKEIRIVQGTAPQLVKEVLQWALEENVPLVCAESYAYQESLLHWFIFVSEQLMIEHILFLGIKREGGSGKLQKNRAIVRSFKSIYEGELILHPSVRSLYYNQAEEFDPSTDKNSDDIVDCVAYGALVFMKYQTEWVVDVTSLPKPNSPTGKKQEKFIPQKYNMRTGQ